MPSEPTEPGWYFWRDTDGGRFPDADWTVTKVERLRDGSLWVTFWHDHPNEAEPIEETRDGEWGPPIPSPERLAELEDVERRLHEARRQVAEATFEQERDGK